MKIALFGRHPSPAEHIVFPEDGVNFIRKTNAKGQQRANTIPDDKMSDYSWMRSICQAWLYEHWEPHMELYVEGFTPMTIAFIREWDATHSKSEAVCGRYWSIPDTHTTALPTYDR